jgi:hypothetical protein
MALAREMSVVLATVAVKGHTFTTERGRVANPPIKVLLQNGTVLDAKSFDRRSNDRETAFVGMDDEIIAVVKSEVTALIMEPGAAKDYFGK